LIEGRIHYFGNAGEDSNRFFVEEINGIKIAFVNYNQFVGSGERDALADLQAAKKAQPDFTIMYTHWGKEFTDTPSERNKELAHEFVDGGADVIIGSHPHVVQTREQYKGKTIYYSLGNFIFDQYFDPNTQKGLAVQVELGSQGKMDFKEYSVQMKTNGQTVFAQ